MPADIAKIVDRHSGSRQVSANSLKARARCDRASACPGFQPCFSSALISPKVRVCPSGRKPDRSRSRNHRAAARRDGPRPRRERSSVSHPARPDRARRQTAPVRCARRLRLSPGKRLFDLFHRHLEIAPAIGQHGPVGAVDAGLTVQAHRPPVRNRPTALAGRLPLQPPGP